MTQETMTLGYISIAVSALALLLMVVIPASNFPSRRHFRPCGMNTWFPTMPKRSGFIAAFFRIAKPRRRVNEEAPKS